MVRKRQWALAVAAAVVVGTIAVGGSVSATSRVGHSQLVVGTAATQEIARTAEAETAAGWFSAAAAENEVALTSVTNVRVKAPRAVAPLEVSLDTAEQEQYWFWAQGVEVTVSGLDPAQSVELDLTTSDGVTKTWGSFTADGSGLLVAPVRYSQISPDDAYPPVGFAQITARTQDGSAGAARLQITPNADEVLKVTVSSPSLSQDEWFDAPVTIRAEGLKPLEKVFFNLGFPDTSAVAVGETEGLHSDENGVFEYQLRAATANSLVGMWNVNIQNETNQYGNSHFEITAGPGRVADKSLTFAVSSISLTDFAEKPGLAYGTSGFGPFDSYQLELVTPRGGQVPLGLARTNGVGVSSDYVLGPTNAPTGTYTLRARSTTTGAYAEGTFVVTDTDGGSSENPVLALSTTSITQAQLSAQGLSVHGSGLVPGTEMQVELRDLNFDRVALTSGESGSATVGADGSFDFHLQTLASAEAGAYRVRVTGSADGFIYELATALTVVPDNAVTPTPAPGSDTAERSAPPSPAPAIPTAPTASPAPAPAPNTPSGDTGGDVVTRPALPPSIGSPFPQVTPGPVAD